VGVQNARRVGETRVERPASTGCHAICSGGKPTEDARSAQIHVAVAARSEAGADIDVDIVCRSGGGMAPGKFNCRVRTGTLKPGRSVDPQVIQNLGTVCYLR